MGTCSRTNLEVDARWQTANIALTEIERMRAGSRTRGNFLRLAGILQVIAIAALSAATLLVIFIEPAPKVNKTGGNPSSTTTPSTKSPGGMTATSSARDPGVKPQSCRPPLSTLFLC